MLPAVFLLRICPGRSDGGKTFHGATDLEKPGAPTHMSHVMRVRNHISVRTQC
jgi:hypothetical protein